MILVMAAIIIREGNVLLTQRSTGELAGYWEFPGGKKREGESAEGCLRRELQEELCIAADIGAPLATVLHSYPGKEIALTGFWVERFQGEIVLTEHRAMVWARPTELNDYRLAPADRPFAALIEDALTLGCRPWTIKKTS